jgi:hypothetical protein
LPDRLLLQHVSLQNKLLLQHVLLLEAPTRKRCSSFSNKIKKKSMRRGTKRERRGRGKRRMMMMEPSNRS